MFRSVVAVLVPIQVVLSTPVLQAADPATGWSESYDAGYVDAKGAWVGGSEIMHLVAHRGRLYAANGYWVDSHWEIPTDAEKQSAQVLRLDEPSAEWQVDLDLGRSNGLGLRYMKGNTLASVRFTRDSRGRELDEPVDLLVMAAGANVERGGAVSVWVRDDADETWTHTLVRHGSNAGGVRWVPRDMAVHRDKVTGIERLFLLIGNPGILSGVYDPDPPGRIRWDRHVEYPFPEKGTFETRPLGIAIADGSLYFAVGGSIFRRNDGPKPTYTEVLHLGYDADTDVGGVRGLTAVPNPNGPGESLLFAWIPDGRSRGTIKRLDPDGRGGFTSHDEANLVDLMGGHLGLRVTNVLGAHNRFYSVAHPRTGETVHVVGMQGNVHGRDELRWPGSRYYAGALYAVRSAKGTYSVHEVDNAYTPGKRHLITPRAFSTSPFGRGDVYIGGHDSNFRVSDDRAWVMRAPTEVVLGLAEGRSAAPPRKPAEPEPRLRKGPLYELRIYRAKQDRFGHLVERFREHTDRLFREHGLEPVGYWLPSDPEAIRPRTFVYLLKHPSRYEAWTNWKAFTLDRRWQQVLDTPRFQGPLADRPTSIFLRPVPGGPSAKPPEAGGVYELRPHVAKPGRLDDLVKLVRDRELSLLARHGITTLGLWTAFDRPEAETLLFTLHHHAGRERATASWKALEADDEWRAVSRSAASVRSAKPGPVPRLYLNPTDFSKMR